MVSFAAALTLFINLLAYRIILFLTPSENFSVLPPGEWFSGLLIGSRFDLSAASMGALFILLTALIAELFPRVSKKIIYGILIFLLLFYCTVSITDWFFYRRISFRIDSRIFPYITNPSLMVAGASDTPIPVFGILVLFLFFCVLNFIIYLKLKKVFSLKKASFSWKTLSVQIATSLIYIFIAVCTLRGFDTRPLKARDYTLHGRDQLNVVSRSPFFQFASEVVLYVKLNRGSRFKGILPEDAVKRLREFMGFDVKVISKNPIEHRLHKCFREKYPSSRALPENPNFVIFQIESFGFNKFKKLPFLRKLARESIFFENAFATGTMTFDGLWSTLCSTLPTYGRLRTALLSNNFQCIPDVLKKQKYKNYYFYAGDLDMDSMRSFANRHGFHHVYEKTSFPPEDQKLRLYLDDSMLFMKALESMRKNSGPFLYYILNSQTHPPDEIPKDFVWPEGVRDRSVFSYFDLSLKKFFGNARKEKFFYNTVFIITADHTEHSQSYNPTDDRKLGSTLWEFRIPLLVYIPALGLQNSTPIRDFVSQVDVVPGIFDILDMNENIRGWGTSMFCRDRIKSPLIMFSRRLSYLTVLKGERILSSAYKSFDINKLLKYNLDNPFDFALFDVSSGGDSRYVKETMEFYYQANRNIISNSYYWK